MIASMMLGSLTMRTSTTTKASRALLERRHPRLRVLKLRNLMVLTINVAGTRTTADASA
jgi:hypothetical protein